MTIAEVTEREFLIAFSYADRDRAKLIRNFRWDPVQKVWRYPLSKRTYQEILREFDPDELEFTGDLSRLAEWNRVAQEDLELNAVPDLTDADTDPGDGLDDYRFVCSLAQMVSDHGVVANTYSELFRFLQGCVLERASEAGTDALLAIQNAELAATRAELSRLRLERNSGSDNFETELVDAAWGDANIPRPEFLMSFRFDSDGVIKATEWVARSLGATLRKAHGAVSLYELAKEAADAQIISKDVHRLCETLRHQRNRFGHDRVGPGETRQHALLALTAFSLIYREVYPKLPSSPPTK